MPVLWKVVARRIRPSAKPLILGHKGLEREKERGRGEGEEASSPSPADLPPLPELQLRRPSEPEEGASRLSGREAYARVMVEFGL